AREIDNEDRRTCRAIGRNGAELLSDGMTVLTHCNAGGLATADYGTALGVIYFAVEQGMSISVFADETRPLLQGARLTAWELQAGGIPVTVLCDNAAPSLMREGLIDAVIVGADRIASNGDAANKIGTYGVALATKAHNIPMYVAAPMSTVDMAISSGDEIPIEERDAHEVSEGFGRRTVPEGVAVRNPAFDVTPADLISGIITEHGVARHPFVADLADWASRIG
ncbi:MAG: S-methyl-5-thioribose-1-phosphate isomerase, partial [Candidatus Latescibacteria bacterium]|nr:S-methyl-5-thioribose-1-phosphate isomerase [Candidatus Latescibacterota bacterium]